jgi:hypothetical protein
MYGCIAALYVSRSERSREVDGSRAACLYSRGMDADRSLTEARDTLIRRRDALDDAIQALDRVIGDGANRIEVAVDKAPAATSKAPRGARTDATEAIIIERGEHGISPLDLARELDVRGIPLRSENPERAARAAGNRARERNGQIKLENGRFVYRPSQTSLDPDPHSSGDSREEGDSRGDLGSPGSLP